MYNDNEIVSELTNFWVVGVNYKKTDVTLRGLFSISDDKYENILSAASGVNIREIFVLSTCNRTEVYGIAENPEILTELLCHQAAIKKELLGNQTYIHNSIKAVEHLFKVAAGMDSQILGDYEIVGQVKQAVKFSKQRGGIGTFIERLANSVLQSSKAIKNQTVLSDGTVSVSFAAIRCIKQYLSLLQGKSILVAGAGKMGRNACKNLVDYLDAKRITLINRTDEKASRLAAKLGICHAPYEKLKTEVQVADIIIVATGAPTPILLEEDFKGHGEKLIIDLSVPCNVDPAVETLENVRLINVDHLSKTKDETFRKREAELPKAKGIIDTHITDFIEWNKHRKHVPVLKAIKQTLGTLNAGVENGRNDDRIQKIINQAAIKIKTNNTIGCCYIEAINEYIENEQAV